MRKKSFVPFVMLAICVLLFGSCGKSASNEDGLKEYANIYHLEDMNIGLSDLWVFRTVEEAKEDGLMSDVVIDKEGDSGFTDACIFHDSMNPEYAYQCYVMKNSGGSESIDELKSGLEQEYSDSIVINASINNKEAVKISTLYEDAIVRQYVTFYGDNLYIIRYVEHEAEEMNEITNAVFKGITFGDNQ